MSRSHDSESSSAAAFSGRPSQGDEVMWLRVPMNVSNPHWVADLLSPYVERNKGRLSIVISAVDLSVPVFVSDLIDAVAAGRDQWVHLDLTLRYIRERDGDGE